MANIKVAQSGLTNKIYAGGLIRGGTRWSANKTDVTIDALVAVAMHVTQFGSDVVISRADGTPEYEISVRKL